MIRSNSRQAKENIRKYIKDWSLDTLEERNEWNRKEGGKVWSIDKDENIAAMIWDIFQDEKPGSDEYYSRRRMYGVEVFKDWAQGLAMGGLFCYYYNREAVDDLAEILQETEEEKAKYKESDAEELLTRLIYREIVALKDKADEPQIVTIEEAKEEKKTIFDRVAAAVEEIGHATSNLKTDSKPETATA